MASASVPTFGLVNLGYSGVNIPVGSGVATGLAYSGGVNNRKVNAAYGTIVYESGSTIVTSVSFFQIASSGSSGPTLNINYGSNNIIIVVPGVYIFSYNVSLSCASGWSTAFAQVNIRQNTTAVGGGCAWENNFTNPQIVNYSGSTILTCLVGDTIDLAIITNVNGGSTTFNGSAGSLQGYLIG